jgi:hypothetical protein
VRHDGVLSTVLCKLFIDDLLNQLENFNCGIRLRDINCGNPAFADDIALLALSPTYMHTLVNIYITYSQNWKFEFISAKADILICHRGMIVSTYPFGFWWGSCHSSLVLCVYFVDRCFLFVLFLLAIV